MNIEPQTDTELATLARLLDGMSTAMLTHEAPDGALVSRPMTALEMDAQGAIWFFIDLRSNKAEHLRTLSLSFADEARATYVSLSGRGEVDTDRGRVARLWTAQARPWFPDGPGSRHLALLKFVPHRAEYWDAPGSRMVRLLALAASSLAGRPIGVGEHETVTIPPPRYAPEATEEGAFHP